MKGPSLPFRQLFVNPTAAGSCYIRIPFSPRARREVRSNRCVSPADRHNDVIRPWRRARPRVAAPSLRLGTGPKPRISLEGRTPAPGACVTYLTPASSVGGMHRAGPGEVSRARFSGGAGRDGTAAAILIEACAYWAGARENYDDACPDESEFRIAYGASARTGTVRTSVRLGRHGCPAARGAHPCEPAGRLPLQSAAGRPGRSRSALVPGGAPNPLRPARLRRPPSSTTGPYLSCDERRSEHPAAAAGVTGDDPVATGLRIAAASLGRQRAEVTKERRRPGCPGPTTRESWRDVAEPPVSGRGRRAGPRALGALGALGALRDRRGRRAGPSAGRPARSGGTPRRTGA